MNPRIATAPAQPATATIAAEPIPFRKQGANAAGDAVHSLLVASVLLAACIAALWAARKKGWLDRWLAHGRPASPQPGGLRVEQALRLSPRTVLYRVAGQGERYLILESMASAASMTPTPGTEAPP